MHSHAVTSLWEPTLLCEMARLIRPLRGRELLGGCPLLRRDYPLKCRLVNFEKSWRKLIVHERFPESVRGNFYFRVGGAFHVESHELDHNDLLAR